MDTYYSSRRSCQILESDMVFNAHWSYIKEHAPCRPTAFAMYRGDPPIMTMLVLPKDDTYPPKPKGV